MNPNCQVIAYNKISNSGQNICKLLATVKENLSALIQRRIRELKTSKAEIARQTSLSRTYITDLANGTGNTQSGQYNLSPESVTKIAKAIQVTEAEILAAMNYLPDNQTGANSIEILDGATVSFDERKFSKAEQEKLLEMMRVIAAGVKAEKEI